MSETGVETDGRDDRNGCNDPSDAVDSADVDSDSEEAVGLYIRVSTEDQSPDRQRQLTSDYATDRFNVAPALIQVYTDK